jgi:hypothetical protein
MSVTLFKDVSRKNSARGLTHSFSWSWLNTCFVQALF